MSDDSNRDDADGFAAVCGSVVLLVMMMVLVWVILTVK
jgi:hypothetical protein